MDNPYLSLDEYTLRNLPDHLFRADRRSELHKHLSELGRYTVLRAEYLLKKGEYRELIEELDRCEIFLQGCVSIGETLELIGFHELMTCLDVKTDAYLELQDFVGAIRPLTRMEELLAGWAYGRDFQPSSSKY